MGNPQELIKVAFPVPMTFSVLDYIEHKKAIGYVNHNQDFMMDQLIEDLPFVLKRFTNDIVAKAMLSHNYGEMLAKDFRNWIREHMREEDELPCGGASIDASSEVTL